MSTVPAAGTVVRTRARRAARQLLAGSGTQDIVVHADAAGAANLMREIVALRDLDVALEEREGHWQVVVRAGKDCEAVLARVIDVTARCVEQGHMECATLCVGTRRYTIHEQPPPSLGIPAFAASPG